MVAKLQRHLNADVQRPCQQATESFLYGGAPPPLWRLPLRRRPAPLAAPDLRHLNSKSASPRPRQRQDCHTPKRAGRACRPSPSQRAPSPRRHGPHEEGGVCTPFAPRHRALQRKESLRSSVGQGEQLIVTYFSLCACPIGRAKASSTPTCAEKFAWVILCNKLSLPGQKLTSGDESSAAFSRNCAAAAAGISGL